MRSETRAISTCIVKILLCVHGFWEEYSLHGTQGNFGREGLSSHFGFSNHMDSHSLLPLLLGSHLPLAQVLEYQLSACICYFHT